MAFRAVRHSLLLALFFYPGCNGGLMQIPNMESAEAQLFMLRCSVCHSLPHPKRHTFHQWTFIVAQMDKLMEKRGIKILSTNEKERILEYLKNNAR